MPKDKQTKGRGDGKTVFVEAFIVVFLVATVDTIVYA